MDEKKHASDVPAGSSKFFYYERRYASASVNNEQMIVDYTLNTLLDRMKFTKHVGV